jgi:hypothetical protein
LSLELQRRPSHERNKMEEHEAGMFTDDRQVTRRRPRRANGIEQKRSMG